MIQRFDQLAVDLPEPDGPNPAAAAAVQELMGGKFGEMSTLMNYTFQSFNFRGRDKYRPFYELICNIAAEEYSHIEAVAATINLLLNGATPRMDRSKTPMPTAGGSAKGKKPAAKAGESRQGRKRKPGAAERSEREFVLPVSLLRFSADRPPVRWLRQSLERQLRDLDR